VTDAEFAAVGARDGRVLARRPLPEGASGARAVEPGEAGAWLAIVDSDEYSSLRGRLVHVPLEGDGTVRSLPVMAPPLEQCRKEYGEGRCRWLTSFAGLAPLDGGGCLVAEHLDFHHDVGGPNRTSQVVLTTLDARGQTLAQRTLGEVESSLEWFWRESSPGNFTIFPGRMGLVRRRYDGSTRFRAAVELAGGDLLVALLGGGDPLKRLDRSLGERWSRAVGRGGSAALSPSWAQGILFYSGGDWLGSFDARGEGGREASLPHRGLEPREARHVIGQTASGEWLLVSY
jgi:hypothetical protein